MRSPLLFSGLLLPSLCVVPAMIAESAWVPLPGHEGVALATLETTVGEFRAFVAATGYNATGDMYTLGVDDYDWLPRGHTWADPGFPQDDTHPVVGVNLADAQAYATWLTLAHRAKGMLGPDNVYRLPTDEEWSAGIGLTDETGDTPEARMFHATSAYPWGVDWPPPAEFGNYAGTESASISPSWWGTIPGGYTDAFARTGPVASYAPNALGIHDLSGNAEEWVDTRYTRGSLAWVTRGGSWGSDRPNYLLLAKRGATFPQTRNDEIGFRLVRAPAPARPAQLPQAESSSTLTPVRVELDWITNAQFAGVLVADQRGWYREVGLEVTVVGVDQESLETVEPVVAAPGICIGVADGSALLRARARGLPIQAFGTMFQASPIGILTLTSRHLTSLSELRGQTIGLHHYDRPQLATMLGSAGLTLDDVTLVDIGNDHESLPAGRLDAQVAYVIDEKVAFETHGHAVDVFPGYAHGYQAYSQVYFTTEKTRATQPEILEKFLAASNRGWRAALADPDAAATMIVARYQPTASVAYQAGSLRLIADLVEVESGGGSMGRMHESTWLATTDATPELVEGLFAPLE